MEENKKIGKAIKKARILKNLRQEDVGRYLNRSKSTISGYENGKKRISVANLRKVCILLEIDSDQFFLPPKVR